MCKIAPYDKLLVVEITRNCNLKCSWCINKLTNSDYGINHLVENDIPRILELVAIYKFSRISISGGECLLYPDVVKNLIIALRYTANFMGTISVFTNAIFLSNDLSNFFNIHNIKLQFSINTEGEKSINNFIKAGGIIDNVLNVKDRMLRYVLLQNVSFYKDIIYLKTVFKCPVHIGVDESSFTEWTEKDIEFLDKELFLYSLYDPSFSDIDISHHSMLYAAGVNCTFKIDNKINWIPQDPFLNHSSVTYGEMQVMDMMRIPEIYMQYKAVITKYLFKNQMELCQC